MTRIASDMVALSTNEPCCCDLADKGIGKKAPKLGVYYDAWKYDPTPHDLVAGIGEPELRGSFLRVLRACLIALLVLSLFGFVAWATFGGRP